MELEEGPLSDALGIVHLLLVLPTDTLVTGTLPDALGIGLHLVHLQMKT